MKKIFTFIIVLATYTSTWSQCVPNTGSLVFNGNSASANIPMNPLLVITNQITIEAWVNAAAFTTAATPFSNTIVCHHGWQYGEQGYGLRSGNNGQLSFNFAGLDTNGNYMSWQDLVTTTTMNLNTWYHVAGTFDGDTQRCYINGVLAASRGFKGSIRDSSAYDVKIGRLAYTTVGQTRYWNGKMDEVRIWNRALSQAELFANKNAHIDPTIQTGLLGYWRFNEGTGTSISDLSGNNLTGTLTSATWSTAVPFNTPTPNANINFSGGQLSVSPAATHYQWYLNSAALPNDTLQSWQPTQSGQYYVVVTDANGCTGISVAINLNNVGLEELNSNSGISIYYSADNQITTIQLEQGIVADKIELYDVSGKMLNAVIGTSSSGYAINCNGYNAGIYMVKIKTNKGVFVNKLSLH